MFFLLFILHLFFLMVQIDMTQGNYELHQGMDYDQLRQRSRHDTLIPIDVKIGIGKKTVQSCLRVSSDARLWRMLGELYLEGVAMQVNTAYSQIIGAGMVKALDVSYIKGAGGGNQANLLPRYFLWSEALKQANLSHKQCMAILTWGLSMREVDASYKQRKGKAKANLVECLRLW